MEADIVKENLAQRGQLLLSSEITDIVTSTTYAKISGTFTNPEEKGIVGDGNKLTVSEAGTYLVIGTSDLSIANTGTTENIFYSLHKNGSTSIGETKHTFGVKNKYENIGIVAFIDLGVDDYLEIYVKSESSNLINIASLSVVLIKV